MSTPMSRNQPAGFTLLELVVASAIFVVLITLAVNVFVLVLRVPIRAIDQHHLYEEVTYVFEQATYQIHHATIDYASQGTMTNPEIQLYLLANDGSGDRYQLYLNSGQINMAVTTSSGTTIYQLTSDPTTDVYIDTLQFYIYPTVDPFDPDSNNNNQPAVVMHMTGHSVHNAAVMFSMQTLITLRVYER